MVSKANEDKTNLLDSTECQQVTVASNIHEVKGDLIDDNDLEIELFNAIENENIDEIKRLLKLGADVGWENTEKMTALHLAAQSGHQEAVCILLEAGASVDARNIASKAALHLATSKGYKKIVHMLLTYGATVDLQDANSNTALHMAVQEGSEEVLQLLLNYGATIDLKNINSDTAFLLAAMDGSVNILKLLLRNFANVDLGNEDSNTALHLAASRGFKSVVQLLLDRGATVDLQNKDLDSALHLAVKEESEVVVQMLLDYGASIDLKNESSNTALHLAASYGFVFVVHLLLSHGANVTLQNINSDTALHLAALNGSEPVVQLLLESIVDTDERSNVVDGILSKLSETSDVSMASFLLRYGANIEGLDADGRTPLVIAVIAAQLDMVSLMIEKKANIEASDNDLLTALHWSARIGHMVILELLLQKEANFGAVTKHGNTALHLAAQFNHSNIVATLIRYTANIDAKNRNEQSPIEVAISNGHVDIVFQLKDAGAKMGMSGDNTLWQLYLATDAGQVELIKRTLDICDDQKKKNYRNATLHRASQHGKIDVVKYLLDHDADIDSLNGDGFPSLFLAGQYLGVLFTLIHRGACTTARSRGNPHISALHHFSAFNRIEALRLLLNCDYMIHSSDDFGNTALHYAAFEGHCDAAAILLQQGVDINAKNYKGETALHVSIEHGSLDMANLLIDFGVDMNATTFTPKSTALHIATESKKLELISLLVKRHASVNAKDRYESTALHYAAKQNLTEECALLIECKAKVNSYDLNGKTPLFYAACNFNSELVKILLDRNASVNCLHNNEGVLGEVMHRHPYEYEYERWRSFIATIKLLTQGGADFTGMKEKMEILEKKFPILQRILTESSNQQLKRRWSTPLSLSSALKAKAEGKGEQEKHEDERKGETQSEDDAIYVYVGLIVDEVDRPDLPRIKLTSNDIAGQQDGYPVADDKEDQSNTSARIASNPPLSMLLDARSFDKRIATIIRSLFSCVDMTFATSGNFFKLVSARCLDAQPPKWAAHFDKMNGVIREPGRLIVQIPSTTTTFSIPQWKTKHPYLQFINAVYVCRRSSTGIDQEAFSDVLGGSEQKLATKVHAVLIAGLSILSIVGGDGLVEKLVTAILDPQLSSTQSVSSDVTSVEWDVRNRRRCSCSSQSVHRPLSPVAAAKAVGMEIWRERHRHFVNRVWDLHQDKLIDFIDARKVIFVTHRWNNDEVRYQDMMERTKYNGHSIGISEMSEKLHRIRKTLQQYTDYVWMDTICIDKSNLTELDEAIRSMYKWYANCAAVVLDSGTTLGMWSSRGWCLQEGAAAGILCGISRDGKLATIKELAKEQNQNLCTLDLHLYYRPGNASEILARMDVRETTRDEDMAYALVGIFSIDWTLSYGEGIRSRARLLHQLAIQHGDLSFLSFQTSQTMYVNYLPATGVTYNSISNCTVASAPVMISHFGICIEVQLVNSQDVKQMMDMLDRWKDYTFAKDRSLGVEMLLQEAEIRNYQTSTSVQLAVVHDIRSLILVEIYDRDLQTGGGLPINICYRLQCCQIEEDEFERLFDETTAEFERIWLGNKPNRAGTAIVGNVQYSRRDRRRRRINEDGTWVMQAE
ncbi:hypothetical protein INT44_007764 [Umbelopsis vinacea]|uniref:Heterokaryon incompatibility domain-containing protein n=1 Tax=Umbelopsis vinacea TaxID=44442 RepID=A0A8H7PL87_9FUNG|nr:hypothetical protein INT44_007764 [Umbelopsis vinacea]